MSRKLYLKILRILFYSHIATLVNYLIFENNLNKWLFIGVAIPWAAMMAYGMYMIIKYNPMLERQDNQDD